MKAIFLTVMLGLTACEVSAQEVDLTPMMNLLEQYANPRSGVEHREVRIREVRPAYFGPADNAPRPSYRVEGLDGYSECRWYGDELVCRGE